jgi:hypothetical protein
MHSVFATALFASVLLSGCRSESSKCDGAKEAWRKSPEAHSLLEGVKHACPEDEEGRAILANAKALTDERAAQAKREAEEAKRVSDQARAKALAELSELWTFAENTLKAPTKTGKMQCFSGDHPQAGWCETSEVASNRQLSAQWPRNNPKAIQIDSDAVTRAPLSCADIDASATVVRRWHWEQAKKVQTHCRIAAGRFAGLGALIQFGKSNTFVSLFSDSYLAKDVDLATTLATQGTTIE